MLTLVTSEILCFKGSIKKALQIAKDIGGQYDAYNDAECQKFGTASSLASSLA